MTVSETGMMPAPRPPELVSIETYMKRRHNMLRFVDGARVDELRSYGPPRPGWPEDFRVPITNIQGIG